VQFSPPKSKSYECIAPLKTYAPSTPDSTIRTPYAPLLLLVAKTIKLNSLLKHPKSNGFASGVAKKTYFCKIKN
jgi:hypothetical protein